MSASKGRKPEKAPRDWSYCSRCDRPYGFINCRFTTNKGVNICLGCAIEEEKSVAKGVHEKVQQALSPTQPRQSEPPKQAPASQEGQDSAGGLDRAAEGQGGVAGDASAPRYKDMEGAFGEESLFVGLDEDTEQVS